MSKRVNNKKGNRASKRDWNQHSKVRGGATPLHYRSQPKNTANPLAGILGLTGIRQ